MAPKGENSRDRRSNNTDDVEYDFNCREDDEDIDPDDSMGSGTKIHFKPCVSLPAKPPPLVIELGGREVIFAILVFFLASVCAGLIIVYATSCEKSDCEKAPPQTHVIYENGKKICMTPDCLRTSLYTLGSMNASSDPCVNFWEFACGGWVAKHPLLPGSTQRTVHDEFEGEISQSLRTLLDAPIKRDSPLSMERKIKLFYKKCMDVDSIDRAGAQPLKEIMDRYGGWAISEDWNLADKSGRWNFHTVLEALHFHLHVAVFFRVSVAMDDIDSEKPILLIEQPDLSPSRDTMLQNESVPELVAYRAYMREAARLFNATKEDTQAFVRETFEFERKLAEITMSMDEMMDINPMEGYNRLNISGLQRMAPRVKWLQFLRHNFTDLRLLSPVLISNMEYMANLSKLLQNTDERVLNYYMFWRLFYANAGLLSKPFRKLSNDFVNNLKASIKKKLFIKNSDNLLKQAQAGRSGTPERWQTCRTVVEGFMPLGVGSLYVQEYFSRDMQDEIMEMIAHIRDTFTERLVKFDWIDNRTTIAAVRKIEKMQFSIGYDDFLINNTKMDRHFATFLVGEEDSFFQVLLNGYHWMTENRIQSLRGNYSEVDGAIPYEINSFYSLQENKLIFTAGILRKPHYQKGVPHYVNYGGIGTIIGHEITHGLDNTGSWYDADGNMVRWWSEESWKNFENRTKCVVDYYSSLKIKGMKVNGENTQGENIADIGGLIQSYNAYKLMEIHKGEEASLPGLEYSNDQIFFIRFAQNWCSNRSPENLAYKLQTDVHAPEEIRTMGALSQVPQFTSVFRCKKNSPLNPRKKCSVW